MCLRLFRCVLGDNLCVYVYLGVCWLIVYVGVCTVIIYVFTFV